MDYCIDRATRMVGFWTSERYAPVPMPLCRQLILIHEENGIMGIRLVANKVLRAISGRPAPDDSGLYPDRPSG